MTLPPAARTLEKQIILKKCPHINLLTKVILQAIFASELIASLFEVGYTLVDICTVDCLGRINNRSQTGMTLLGFEVYIQGYQSLRRLGLQHSTIIDKFKRIPHS